MIANDLKIKLKSIDNLDNAFRTRIHRSISWLKEAELNEQNSDLQFILLWIGFNASYAIELGTDETAPERKRLHTFLERIVAIDQERKLFHLIWTTYSGPIRILIENRFVYKLFWDFQRGMSVHWESEFNKSIERANSLLAKGDVAGVMEIVLDRLYVLRNQLIHGGSTCGSKVNRKQVQDGCRIMLSILPVILEIMLTDPYSDWGEIAYPVV